ncbi:S1 family peptidase [Dehalococcoidia bacterium]|nr:S1 family peptidase [Dehalococcoidia bacterium]
MKLKGIRTIALLLAAVILVVGSVAGIAAAGGEERDEEFQWDARYWWEALPISPHHQQQAREVGILIFDRYFGIDISAMSPQELDELWDVIGHENQEKAERLFAQYATAKGFEIPGMPAPKEEFVAPPDATYWWEFIDPELRDAAIGTAKMKLPEMVRSYWELADWKGVELPIPRPEELCVMTLTLEEYEQILAPPRFPLGRVGVEEWLERFYPGSNIIAVFGRTRTYDDPTEWFDALLEARRLMRPLYPLLFRELGVTSIGIIGAGYIHVQLDCGKLTPEEAEAIATKIYDMIAPKAETVGIEGVPAVFVLEAAWTEEPLKRLTGGEGAETRELSNPPTFKDPREHLTTPLPLDQGFRPVPGGAQVARGDGFVATIGFPVRDPIPLWPDDEDLTTVGHLVPIINTPQYQPLPPHQIGTIADTGSFGGHADIARVATPDGDVIPYVRTGFAFTLPILGWRDPKQHETASIFGRTSGPVSGQIYRVGVTRHSATFGFLENQVEASIWLEGGDSGAPLFGIGPGAGVTVKGIAGGHCKVRRWIGIFSPVSGVMHELPGWYPYTQ